MQGVHCGDCPPPIYEKYPMFRPSRALLEFSCVPILGATTNSKAAMRALVHQHPDLAGDTALTAPHRLHPELERQSDWQTIPAVVQVAHALPDDSAPDPTHLTERDPHTRVVVTGFDDIVKARETGRALAQAMDFPPTRITLITTAISELARNIVLYAGRGEIHMSPVTMGFMRGMDLKAVDHGEGIEDVEEVLKGGYSTSGGLGLGLRGLQRIADQFELDSARGQGTRVHVTFWSEPAVAA